MENIGLEAAAAADGMGVVAVAAVGVAGSDALKRWKKELVQEKELVVKIEMDRGGSERSYLVHPRLWGSFERLENGVGVLDGAGSLIWYSLTSKSAPQLWEHLD